MHVCVCRYVWFSLWMILLQVRGRHTDRSLEGEWKFWVFFLECLIQTNAYMCIEGRAEERRTSGKPMFNIEIKLNEQDFQWPKLKGKELSPASSGASGCDVDMEKSKNPQYRVLFMVPELSRTLETNNIHRMQQAQHWTARTESSFCPHCWWKLWNTCLNFYWNRASKKRRAWPTEHQCSFVSMDTRQRNTSQWNPNQVRGRETEKKKKHCDKSKNRKQS